MAVSRGGAFIQNVFAAGALSFAQNANCQRWRLTTIGRTITTTPCALFTGANVMKNKEQVIEQIEAGVNAADKLKDQAGERVEKLWRGVKVPRRNTRAHLRAWVKKLTPVARQAAVDGFEAGAKVAK